jgi:hypothetical protein
MKLEVLLLLRNTHVVKGPILVPFESGQITVVLGQNIPLIVGTILGDGYHVTILLNV